MKKMLKKVMALVLSVMMIIAALPMTASAEIYGDLTYEINEGEVTITDCDESISGDVVIPETIDGYPVIAIGYDAFYFCEDLTSITIPDGVISIGDYAFEYCDSLTSVTIGNGVTSIGDYAFCGCLSLTSITIPDSVTSIGDYAFCDCKSLTSVTIGNGVTSIGDYAFEYCDSLTSVTIGNGVTSIGDCAFWDCSSLTSITIPDGVISIGWAAFWDCSSLISITIPDSVTSIGYSAFFGCSSLTSITVDENNAKYSNDEHGVLFNKNKTELIQYPRGNDRTEYTIPDSVTSIGDYAFHGCGSLINITIPDSVTTIGDDAFCGCLSLTSITIPDSVTSIGNYAFNYCKSLTSITIPESVTSIGEYTFFNCSSFTSITIPDSVTSIGHCAFSYCSSLTSITIPDSVTTIGVSAFSYCDSLTSITIPDSVTSIGYGAFYECDSLESVTICNPDCEIDDSDETIDSNATIYGYEGSTAQAYAEKYGREFVALDKECEHNYVEEITTPATCTEKGEKTFTCSVCGDVKTEEIEALGHKWVDATCSAPRTCTVCQATEGSALGHNIVVVTGAPATCTEDGMTDGQYCTRCDMVVTQKVIPALGHDWNEITDSYKVCNRCGETDGVLAYDTTVTVSNVTGRPGETVDVYVSFGKDTDVKTMSISDIVYDSDKLTLVKGEWLADGSVIDDWDQNKKAGVITFKENTTLSGNVFVLTFKIKDELEDCEVVIDCDFGIKAMNENNVETALAVEVVPGSVTITNIIKGDVNGDDYVDSNDAIHLLYNTMLPDLYEVNQNCDFNGDGYVDSNDAIYLLYYTMLPDIYPLS